MNKERTGFDVNWPERLASYSETEKFCQYYPKLREKLELKTPEEKPDPQRVFLFIGTPGTGKSTISDLIADIHPSLVIRTDWIFFDQLKDVISDDYYKAYVYRRELTKHFLSQGYSLVLDSNIRKVKDRKAIYHSAEENQAQSVLLHLQCPIDVAARREILKGGESRSFEEKKQGLEKATKEIEPPSRLDHQRSKVISLNTALPLKNLSAKLTKLLR